MFSLKMPMNNYFISVVNFNEKIPMFNIDDFKKVIESITPTLWFIIIFFNCFVGASFSIIISSLCLFLRRNAVHDTYRV